MANTTNFNWETPDDTDLVKDGAAAIRTLGSAIDTSLVDLKGGTTGQVLSKATNTDMDFTWITSDDANAIQNAIVDAKGDLVAASAADTPARLAVGTDNQRLVAASGEATGLKYVSDTQNTVIDAAGDLLYGTAADTIGKLAIGTAGQVLKVNAGATAPEWGAAGGASALTYITTVSPSAVISQSVNDCFSSTYKNYLIVINVDASAAADGNNFGMRMRVSGSDNSSANYQFFGIDGTSAGTTVSGNAQSSTSYFRMGDIGAGGEGTIKMFISNPYASEKTSYVCQSNGTGTSHARYGNYSGNMTVTTSYTGFTIFLGSGDFTGSIRVYGVSNS